MNVLRPRSSRTLFAVTLPLLALLAVSSPSLAQPINSGVAFLTGAQQADGSWGSPQATTEALRALQAVNQAPAARSVAADFLESEPIADDGDRARRVVALLGEGRDASALVTALVASADPGGGWGSPFVTSLVLTALAQASQSSTPEAMQGIASLVAAQNTDGGWPCVSPGVSEAACTARALLALWPYRGIVSLDAQIGDGAGFLQSQINPDGSIGAAPDPVFDTASAAQALVATGNPAQRPLIQAYMEAQQLADGSWNGDPHLTGEVLLALHALTSPLLHLSKDGALDLGPNGAVNPGDLINYTFVVTNTGAATLTNVTVSDPMVPSITCPGGNPILSLPVGAMETCTGTYAITQVDIDAGGKHNTATAISNETPPVADNHTLPIPAIIVINEILQNPTAVSDTVGEWIELFNPTSFATDIEGFTLADNGSNSHVIANGGPLVIAAGGFLVLGRAETFADNGGVVVDYQYSGFSLDNSDDEVILRDTLGFEVDRVEYDGGPSFPDPSGASMALVSPAAANNIGSNWCTSSTPFGDGDLGTPGAANDCPLPVLVINEIMQNPTAVSDGSGEWFEIFNPTGAPIDIDGWTIKDDGIDSHTISSGGSLLVPAVGHLVLGNNADSGTNGGVGVDYQYSDFALANGGDEVVLIDTLGNEIDRVNYDGGPAFPDPSGASLALVLPSFDNNVGANWCTSSTPFGSGDSGTPGTMNDCPGTPEIYDIQSNGASSPFEDLFVITRENDVTAVGMNGFFIQTPAARDDSDPATSNGIFVFTGGAPGVAVGDRVTIGGKVVEFFSRTQFDDAGLTVTVTSSGNPLPPPVLLDALNPDPGPFDPPDLERFEGMLVELVDGIATGATDTFGFTAVTVGPARNFREPGIEFPSPFVGPPVWDGNQEVFEIDPDVLGLPDADIFATQAVSAIGPLAFSFGDYQVWPKTLTLGAAPAILRPVRARNPGEFTVGSFNLFRTNGGLAKLSAYIVDVLRAPDILAVQEVQDIAQLEALADQIALADPAVVYTASLIEGNDVGGIDVGFLTRQSIQIDSLTQVDPGATFVNPVNLQDNILHDRPPLLLEGSVQLGGGSFPIAVMAVHNRSQNGIDNPIDGARARKKRFLQAVSIADEVEALQAADPAVRLVVIGDFNAFEFTDGYVDTVGILTGGFVPDDNLICGEQDCTGLPGSDLFNVTLDLPAEERYSFVFGGNAQALDHALTSPALTSLVTDRAYGRGNADAAADLINNGASPLRASDHDGLVLFVLADDDGDGFAPPADCDDGDPDAFPGNTAPDLCDGVDDDCDGQTDEDHVPTPTGCGVGECASTGTLDCVAGAMTDTCIAGSPTGADEDCDGLDQDCDGTADDGYVATPTNCGVGECAAAGTLECVAGSTDDTCMTGTPTIEACDNLDNDCDGAVDDDCGAFQMESNTVTADGIYDTVNLINTYVDPIVVATVQYVNNTTPVVTRVDNVTPTSFGLYLQNPSGGTPASDTVHYWVVERGVWEVDGVKLEADKYLSTDVDRKGAWLWGVPQTYGQTYAQPVVLGQVMTENDPRWSVFFAQGTNHFEPPTATALKTGRHIGEDTMHARANETIGYIVVEAVHTNLAGVEFEAAQGLDTVQGIPNGAPFAYNFNNPFGTAPTVVVASSAGMDGGDGGWAQLHGAPAASPTQLFLSIDEDQIGDNERSHTTEQVTYAAFAGPMIFPVPPMCTIDAECSDGNFCNGDERCDANQVCRPGVDPCPGQPCDEAGDVCLAGGAPKMESVSTVAGGGTVTLVNSYLSPVIACTPVYDANNVPVVVRVANVTGTGFSVSLQNPGDLAPVDPDPINCLVVEEGSWMMDGHPVEARKYLSVTTDKERNWLGTAQSLTHAFTNPVVLGQVMSTNDPDPVKWSVYWQRGTAQNQPPSATALRNGKTVCEDPDGVRADETIGFIVFEQSNGTIGGVSFEAALGPDTVQGIDNGPPDVYTFNVPFDNPPTHVIATQAGMDGSDGSWAYLFGAAFSTTTTLSLAVDEDQIFNAERGHTTEQVGYVAFETPVVFPRMNCTLDSECDDGNFCNGAETCNTGSGICEAGTPPVCDDGVNCTDDACNEVTDSCDFTPSDANCDNGQYCDGAETCSATLDCQVGTPVDCGAFTCDEVTDTCPSGGPQAQMEWGAVSGVGGLPPGKVGTPDKGGPLPSVGTTVNLTNTYVDPVVVVSIRYENNTLPVVARVTNVLPNRFNVYLQNPSGGAVAADAIDYMVVEKGTWVIDGVAIEAQKYTSTKTAHDGDWSQFDTQTYGQTYTNPVVLGQVMSDNDANFSEFWSRGASRAAAPSATALHTGKMVGEDPNTVRANETIGFIVIEAGHGFIGGVEFESKVSTDSVAGVVSSPPYTDVFTTSFASPPEVAVATQTAMDGFNGGWMYTFGPMHTSATVINLAGDEDQLQDAERTRATEQAAYVVFQTPGSFSTRPVNLQILAINDFHGNIATSSGSFGGTGRADFLAANIASAEANADNSIFVSAGDLIGTSPLISALFHDEPTIEVMNILGLDINGVGDHEFDEGPDELLRMAFGGSHPVDGDLDGDPFAGADFEFLAANVVVDATGDTLFEPYTIRNFQGVDVAFIGMTLEGTPSLVSPNGVAGLTFNDEAETVNGLIPELQQANIESIVVLLHEGGLSDGGQNDCGTGLTGPIAEIVPLLDDAVDLVIAGHTNDVFICEIDGKWVTMADTRGRMFTDIDVTLHPVTRDMTVVAINNVPNLQFGVTPDPTVTALIDRYDGLSASLANVVVGTITSDITRTNNAAGESAFGDVITDAQLNATASAGTGDAVVAFANPGGIRADLVFLASGPELDGEVTFGEAFSAQPFGNSLVTMTLTGAQIDTLLEQQWVGQTSPRILQVSDGFTYTWDANEPDGSKVDPATIKVGGVTVGPGTDYRVTVNSFMATGGDNFSELVNGTNRLGGEIDVDALVTYFGTNSPVAPGPQDRITRLN